VTAARVEFQRSSFPNLPCNPQPIESQNSANVDFGIAPLLQPFGDLGELFRLGNLDVAIVSSVGIGVAQLIHQRHQAFHVINPVETDAHVGRPNTLQEVRR
jgi:hypothetical protein